MGKIIRKIALLFLFVNSCFAQSLLLPNEESIFSFETQNGKTITIAKDKNDNYIVYRFGTNSKMEFEFPTRDKNSWEKFIYSYYLRGGGKQNEGMDLNYLVFVNGNFKYVIYDTYFSIEEKREIGIKVINLITKKEKFIKGIYKSRRGKLIDFRFNNLLKIDEDFENATTANTR